MARSKAGTFLSIALALAIAGCGDDDEGLTKPAIPPPNVAGTYSGYWVLQVLRESDGFQKQFQCSGQVTLQQSGTDSSTGVLTGWASVNAPCTPESYGLVGTVSAGGVIRFTTSGPAPLEGPCPGGESVAFAGQSAVTSGGSYRLSARGVTNVTCPQFGEHQFTYIIEGWRHQ